MNIKEQIAKQEARLALCNVFNNVGTLLLSLNPRNFLQMNYVSSEVVQSLGLRREEVVEKSLFYLLPKFLSEYYEDLFDSLLKTQLHNTP